MRIPHLRLAAIALAAGIGLGGCAYNSPFGYGGLSVGYGNGYNDPYYGGYSSYGYGSPYGYGCGSPYGYGYGSPYGYGSSLGYGNSYWGWNNGFYYPGTGYYVYDISRRRHVWSDRQRRYWNQRRSTAGTSSGSTVRENWSGFTRDRQAGARATRVDRGNRTLVQNRDRSTRIERRNQVRSTTTAQTDSDNPPRRGRRPGGQEE